MMKSTGTKLLLAVSLLAIGACAKKPPKELPPPPVDTSAQQAPPPTDGRALPGSQADFVASVLADRVFFATDSSDVDQPSQGTLQSQAQWFAKYPNVRVTVEGHADERGTREYNLALGDRRANAAKNALIALGVSASRITTISYGKERPDAIGSDEAAYAKNRRAVSVTVQ
jgi:peptidoglycan-associated lipoprotein